MPQKELLGSVYVNIFCHKTVLVIKCPNLRGQACSRSLILRAEVCVLEQQLQLISKPEAVA